MAGGEGGVKLTVNTRGSTSPPGAWTASEYVVPVASAGAVNVPPAGHDTGPVTRAPAIVRSVHVMPASPPIEKRGVGELMKAVLGEVRPVAGLTGGPECAA